MLSLTEARMSASWSFCGGDMASGKMHTAVTLAVGAAGTVALAVSPLSAHAVSFAAGALAAVLVQPDLDHPSGYIGLAILRRVPVTGRAMAAAWRLYWTPYRWVVGLATRRRPGAGDSHRSWLSHLPPVGTVLRLVWLSWPVWALWGWWLPPVGALAALVVCDILHAVMDGVQW